MAYFDTLHCSESQLVHLLFQKAFEDIRKYCIFVCTHLAKQTEGILFYVQLNQDYKQHILYNGYHIHINNIHKVKASTFFVTLILIQENENPAGYI